MELKLHEGSGAWAKWKFCFVMVVGPALWVLKRNHESIGGLYAVSSLLFLPSRSPVRSRVSEMAAAAASSSSMMAKRISASVVRARTSASLLRPPSYRHAQVPSAPVSSPVFSSPFVPVFSLFTCSTGRPVARPVRRRIPRLGK